MAQRPPPPASLCNEFPFLGDVELAEPSLRGRTLMMEEIEKKFSQPFSGEKKNSRPLSRKKNSDSPTWRKKNSGEGLLKFIFPQEGLLEVIFPGDGPPNFFFSISSVHTPRSLMVADNPSLTHFA